jgi:hypothetical protein
MLEKTHSNLHLKETSRQHTYKKGVRCFLVIIAAVKNRITDSEFISVAIFIQRQNRL